MSIRFIAVILYLLSAFFASKGTVVVAGRARAVVIGVGSNTAMGSIRDAMLRTEDVSYYLFIYFVKIEKLNYVFLFILIIYFHIVFIPCYFELSLDLNFDTDLILMVLLAFRKRPH